MPEVRAKDFSVRRARFRACVRFRASVWVAVSAEVTIFPYCNLTGIGLQMGKILSRKSQYGN